MALLLPMMLGTTACGLTPKIEASATDPVVLAACPTSAEDRRPGALPPRTLMAVPAGTQVQLQSGEWQQLDEAMWLVPLDQANARENMLVEGAGIFRSMWTDCLSVVRYVIDRENGLAQ